MCITTYQRDTKSNPNPNPNPNPTTKQHAIVNIQLNIVTCPIPREIHTRHVVAKLKRNWNKTKTSLYKNYSCSVLCDKPTNTSMFVTPVGPEELQRLVNSLTGMDNIGPRLVKLVFPVICYALLHTYNLSLSTGVVPKNLRLQRLYLFIRKVMPTWPVISYRPVYLINFFKNYS